MRFFFMLWYLDFWDVVKGFLSHCFGRYLHYSNTSVRTWRLEMTFLKGSISRKLIAIGTFFQPNHLRTGGQESPHSQKWKQLPSKLTNLSLFRALFSQNFNLKSAWWQTLWVAQFSMCFSILFSKLWPRIYLTLPFCKNLNVSRKKLFRLKGF